MIAAVVVCGSLAMVAAWLVAECIAGNRFARKKIAEGYTLEFVITCSADPGGWEWVKTKAPQ